MTNQQNPELCTVAYQALRDVRSYVARSASRELAHDSLKFGEKDIKLKLDTELHELIQDSLSPLGLAVKSEEGDRGASESDELYWLIDPLDGSANFSRGLPNYCVSIALCKAAQPLAGFVYDCDRDLSVSSHSESGVCEPHESDGKQCPKSDNLEDAFLATGIPLATSNIRSEISLATKHFSAVKKVRMYGSACKSLLYTAEGRIDLYHERGIYLWDVAAGLSILESKGGKYHMEKNQFGGWNVTAARNESLIYKFLEISEGQ